MEKKVKYVKKEGDLMIRLNTFNKKILNSFLLECIKKISKKQKLKIKPRQKVKDQKTLIEI